MGLSAWEEKAAGQPPPQGPIAVLPQVTSKVQSRVLLLAASELIKCHALCVL